MEMGETLRQIRQLHQPYEKTELYETPRRGNGKSFAIKRLQGSI
jgi:hypothetical protein